MSARYTPETLAPWVEVRFDPAQGPGGQHVNRAHTRATLIFDLEACTLLSERARERLRREQRGRLTRDGRLRLVAQEHRERARNVSAAEERLCALLEEASFEPKTRRATRPTRSSQRRRVDTKRRRGDTKRQRRPPGADD